MQAAIQTAPHRLTELSTSATWAPGRDPASGRTSPARIAVRSMLEADIPGVIALQRRAFPKMPPWTANQLKRHLKTFPEGQLVALGDDGRVIGSASSHIVTWEKVRHQANWGQVTGNGSFRTHDPAGDTLYGADVGVDPDVRGQGVGAALYAARRSLARRLGLARIAAGGRIPGYGAVAATMTAADYVAEVAARRRHDTVLSFQLEQGFAVQGVLPRYLPCDRASLGWATLLVWENPIR